MGAAEAYMAGFWQTPDLTAVVRLMARNLPLLAQIDRRQSLWQRLLLQLFSVLHSNSEQNARRNIAAHYDLGNDFFRLFLDQEMMYSAAVFADEDTDLDTAALAKLDLVCQKLDLHADDHLLEIGSGWGGLACHAARYYGCRVTTTTISREQYEAAVAKVKALGLETQVTVLFEDYRKLQGQYDKLVSIEMIEAVGHEYYGEYFACCARLLKPHGKMLIQAILVDDQRYDAARKRVDFIKRYIFPGGCLPSLAQISSETKASSDLYLLNVDDITYDYALTLRAWRQRFEQQLDAVRAQGYDEAFIRMWRFYLAYCEGGFMERSIHTAQLLFARPQWRDPRFPR